MGILLTEALGTNARKRVRISEEDSQSEVNGETETPQNNINEDTTLPSPRSRLRRRSSRRYTVYETRTRGPDGEDVVTRYPIATTQYLSDQNQNRPIITMRGSGTNSSMFQRNSTPESSNPRIHESQETILALERRAEGLRSSLQNEYGINVDLADYYGGEARRSPNSEPQQRSRVVSYRMDNEASGPEPEPLSRTVRSQPGPNSPQPQPPRPIPFIRNYRNNRTNDDITRTIYRRDGYDNPWRIVESSNIPVLNRPSTSQGRGTVPVSNARENQTTNQENQRSSISGTGSRAPPLTSSGPRPRPRPPRPIPSYTRSHRPTSRPSSSTSPLIPPSLTRTRGPRPPARPPLTNSPAPAASPVLISPPASAAPPVLTSPPARASMATASTRPPMALTDDLPIDLGHLPFPPNVEGRIAEDDGTDHEGRRLRRRTENYNDYRNNRYAVVMDESDLSTNTSISSEDSSSASTSSSTSSTSSED